MDKSSILKNLLPQFEINLSFEDCEKILTESANKLSVTKYFAHRKEKVWNFITLIIRQLKSIMKSEGCTPLTEEQEGLSASVCLEIINGYVLEVEDPDFLDFIKAFTLTLNNWALATGNAKFASFANTLYVLMNYKANTLCMIEQMRYLISYARQFNTFNPPAFHRSREYIESLYVDLNEGKTPGDRNK